MNRIGRQVRAAINPVSTAATRWWCTSALRHMLTGYGPTAEQQRLIRHRTRGTGLTPSAEQMKARAAAIDELLSREDHPDLSPAAGVQCEAVGSFGQDGVGCGWRTEP
jgi:hypothetical protein